MQSQPPLALDFVLVLRSAPMAHASGPQGGGATSWGGGVPPMLFSQPAPPDDWSDDDLPSERVRKPRIRRVIVHSPGSGVRTVRHELQSAAGSPTSTLPPRVPVTMTDQVPPLLLSDLDADVLAHIAYYTGRSLRALRSTVRFDIRAVACLRIQRMCRVTMMAMSRRIPEVGDRVYVRNYGYGTIEGSTGDGSDGEGSAGVENRLWKVRLTVGESVFEQQRKIKLVEPWADGPWNNIEAQNSASSAASTARNAATQAVQAAHELVLMQRVRHRSMRPSPTPSRPLFCPPRCCAPPHCAPPHCCPPHSPHPLRTPPHPCRSLSSHGPSSSPPPRALSATSLNHPAQSVPCRSVPCSAGWRSLHHRVRRRTHCLHRRSHGHCR